MFSKAHTNQVGLILLLYSWEKPISCDPLKTFLSFGASGWSSGPTFLGSLFVSLSDDLAVIIENNQFTQEWVTVSTCPETWGTIHAQPVALASQPNCKENSAASLGFPNIPNTFWEVMDSKLCLMSILSQVFLGTDTMVDTQWGLTLTSTPHGLGPNIDQSAVISLCSLRCLTPDAEARPDIVEVSSMISDVMMKYLDNLSTSQLALEKKLERERKRTQRYFMEANRNAVTCHRELALLSHVSADLSVSSW